VKRQSEFYAKKPWDCSITVIEALMYCFGYYGTVQVYFKYSGEEKCLNKYQIWVFDIIEVIRNQKQDKLFLLGQRIALHCWEFKASAG
jgi:hypothetical protein